MLENFNPLTNLLFFVPVEGVLVSVSLDKAMFARRFLDILFQVAKAWISGKASNPLQIGLLSFISFLLVSIQQ